MLACVVDVVAAGADGEDGAGMQRAQSRPQRAFRQGAVPARRGDMDGCHGRRGVDALVRAVRNLETGEDPISGPAGSALGHQVVRPLWLELQEETMRRLDALTLEELCSRAHRAGIEGRLTQAGDFDI